MQWYNKKQWLCGCQETSALYCFPCLIFGGEPAWTDKGFTNLNKLTLRTGKHDQSRKHIDNMVSFSLLGNVNIRTHLSDAYQRAINVHNEKVRRNRKILSILIDSVFYCGFQEIGLRGHDESETSINPGGFRPLLRYACKLDKGLESHFENSTVFKGISSTVQNEILECALEVYRGHIVSEVAEAPFVAVIADETTDVSTKNQMSIVLRYLCKGKVVERFWVFFYS